MLYDGGKVSIFGKFGSNAALYTAESWNWANSDSDPVDNIICNKEAMAMRIASNKYVRFAGNVYSGGRNAFAADRVRGGVWTSGTYDYAAELIVPVTAEGANQNGFVIVDSAGDVTVKGYGPVTPWVDTNSNANANHGNVTRVHVGFADSNQTLLMLIKGDGTFAVLGEPYNNDKDGTYGLRVAQSTTATIDLGTSTGLTTGHLTVEDWHANEFNGSSHKVGSGSLGQIGLASNQTVVPVVPPTPVYFKQAAGKCSYFQFYSDADTPRSSSRSPQIQPMNFIIKLMTRATPFGFRKI